MYEEGPNDTDADADAMLDHAISGCGCECLTGQDYPDAELRVLHSRQQVDGTDRLDCLDMPCLRPWEHLVHSIALGRGLGVDSTPDVPRDGPRRLDHRQHVPCPRTCVVS